MKKSGFLTSASEVVIVSAAFARHRHAYSDDGIIKGKDQLSQTWLAHGNEPPAAFKIHNRGGVW